MAHSDRAAIIVAWRAEPVTIHDDDKPFFEGPVFRLDDLGWGCGGAPETR